LYDDVLEYLNYKVLSDFYVITLLRRLLLYRKKGHDFLDGFSTGIGFDGMLASLIAKNNIALVPVLSGFIAILKQGALAMERFTGVPKSLIDGLIAMFILFATMEGLFIIKKKIRKDKVSEDVGKSK